MAGHLSTSNALSERSESKGLADIGLPDVNDDGIVVVMPWVYILRCSDGTLYVGHTNDLVSRERAHNQGHGSCYTAARRPVRIVYSEPHDSIDRAVARERQLKGWTTEKKEALVTGDAARLKLLSRRRNR